MRTAVKKKRNWSRANQINMLTRKATVSEGAGAKEPALSPTSLLDVAVAVARHEHRKAVLWVAVGLKLRRLRLEPADGPIGVVGFRAGQAAAAVGRHDDHVVLPVDPGLPAAAAPAPDPPRPRAAAAGAGRVERDGVRLPEAGGEVREGGARQRRGRELVSGHPPGTPWPQPLCEAVQRHGNGASKEKKRFASNALGAPRSDSETKQNAKVLGSAKSEPIFFFRNQIQRKAFRPG
jgi:hypothetical protein